MTILWIIKLYQAGMKVCVYHGQASLTTLMHTCNHVKEERGVFIIVLLAVSSLTLSDGTSSAEKAD